MRISIILTSFLFIALNAFLVSADKVNLSGKQPKDNFETPSDKNVLFQIKAQPVNGTAIQSVLFILKDPNGDLHLEVGVPKDGSMKWKTKRQLQIEGVWQWKVIAIDSRWKKKNSYWFNIKVGSNEPNAAPSPAPIPTPVSKITPSPSSSLTLPPTPKPSSPLTLSPSRSGEPPKITEASDDIRTLISNDAGLGPKFVRLGFHMCVGGCDGCVDMSNLDNTGLLIPIDALAPVVSTYRGNLSRADIWALATIVAAEEAQRRDDHIPMPFEWVGRTDCSSATGKTGPAQNLPPVDLTTHELMKFFLDNFGLSTRETVALMGAHTIGQLRQQNSGFIGPDGWTAGNGRLDNGYYKGLVGGDEVNDRLEDQTIATLFEARDWTRETINNSANPFPDRQSWFHVNGQGNVKTIMTNVDIAVVRDFTGQIDANGQVGCKFRKRDTPCPAAEQTLLIAAEFKWDDELWREEFYDVMVKMLLNGYNVGNPTCNRPPCSV